MIGISVNRKAIFEQSGAQMTTEDLDWNSAYWRTIRLARNGDTTAVEEVIRALVSSRHAGRLPWPYHLLIARAILRAVRNFRKGKKERQKVAAELLEDLAIWKPYKRAKDKRSKHAEWATDAFCEFFVALSRRSKNSRTAPTITNIKAEIARRYLTISNGDDSEDHALAANLDRVFQRNAIEIRRALNEALIVQMTSDPEKKPVRVLKVAASRGRRRVGKRAGKATSR